MNRVRRKRLTFVLLVVFGMGIAVSLTLYALQQNINLFFSPSQIVAGEAPHDRSIRVGGLVVKGSVKREPDSLGVEFTLTDTAQQIRVRYEGILPDLFREGQGIVARGELNADGTIRAEEVLAKHDEKYMPPEVADSLKQAGLWQHAQPPKQAIQ
ncbi:MAG: cytochrome c maturation protein CcmE [Gammaproteobacteria bacterium]|nr:cytochrome c maturation protein CcmE [Gammaproteobacteria bacterium]MCP5424824.1 cytochrome c maturation protein CcmE [Gammaproteobacteria bacterium]MCP5458199.1 cytochrome c maturation protein CcmE [Gammaproteobacteria bacterium]